MNYAATPLFSFALTLDYNLKTSTAPATGLACPYKKVQSSLSSSVFKRSTEQSSFF